jgi:azobenzene reductase
MKVLLLSGNIGHKSYTRTLLGYLESICKEKGLDTIFWDIADKPLPIAIPEYHQAQHKHPDKLVREFAKVVKEVDGFILGSPLYHDSYSGVLKNALDNLPNKVFNGKPVALVSHSSNARSCVTPCNSLRPVVRSLGGYATVGQVGTTDQDYEDMGEEYEVTSEKVKDRARRLIEELINLIQNFAKLH